MGKLRDQIIWCMVGACDDTCKYYRDNACENNELLKEVEEKLKLWQHYEDMEEQGRLYTCILGVGNKAYLLRPSRVIEEYIVSEVNISRDGESYFAHSYGRFAVFNEDDIGDTWFLTKEEAEAKLKELEDGKKENIKG